MKLDSTIEFWLKLTDLLKEYNFQLSDEGFIKTEITARDSSLYIVRIACDDLGPRAFYWAKCPELDKACSQIRI